MKKIFLWPLAVLFLTSLACQFPFGSGGEGGLIAGLTDADYLVAEVSDDSLLAPVGLSSAQRQVLGVRGRPNRFMIRFSDGMREETWYYDLLGLDVTFRNGETYTENQSIPISAGLVLKSDYMPWQFNGAMGISELLAISGSDVFALESLESVFEEDVSLITLPGLDAGFRGEKLLYVRTIPMRNAQSTTNVEVQGAVDQPPLGDNLTEAEKFHEGTHTYRTYCIYSDGTTDDYVGPVTWSFMEEGVYFDAEGPYPLIRENFYGFSDGEGKIFIDFKLNVITITGEFFSLNEEGETIMDSFTCALTQE